VGVKHLVGQRAGPCPGGHEHRPGRRRVRRPGERGTWPATARLAGYGDALGRRGIAVDRTLVRHGNRNADSGYSEARKVLSLRRPPTALLCGNDRMALGAYDAIKELGLRIPDDVSVIGYDDQQEIVAYLRPPLTTVRLPITRWASWPWRRSWTGSASGARWSAARPSSEAPWPHPAAGLRPRLGPLLH